VDRQTFHQHRFRGAELASLELKTNGWLHIPSALATSPVAILSALGPLIPSREGLLHRDLMPLKRDSAPPASMSSKTGPGEQPMHTDAAFYPTPPRYIAFQCLEPGEASCPTHVWTLDLARLKRDRPTLLTTAGWVAHGGGCLPFYCSVMEVRREETRIRFDPFCMRPICRRIDAVDKVKQALGDYSQHFSFEWKTGSMLIVDNWRCLHARGSGGEKAPSRRLRRWSIGVDYGLVDRFSLR
jgi:hypothetical protein